MEKKKTLIEDLIAALTCLPGVGKKTAQRMTYHLLQRAKDDALNFMLDEKKGLFSKVDDRYIAFQPLFSWILNQKSWVENKNVVFNSLLSFFIVDKIS